MMRGKESNVYEVFVKSSDDVDAPIRWVGNIRADDPELAWHAAKETFLRRNSAKLLWVAQRSAMVMSGPEDEEVLRAASRMKQRFPALPGGARRARERA